MISKTYCPYPFIGCNLQADNTVLPCCQFMKTSLFEKTIPISEIRSGKAMQNIRQQMIDGERVDGCQCFAEEDIGIKSMRLEGISRYGFTTDTEIKQLSVIIDNVCNIKCRSCGAANSHTWYDDEVEIYGRSFVTKKYVKNDVYKDLTLSKLIDLEILGGEPMYSPGVKDFLYFVKRQNILKNITLQLSTNGTILPTDIVLEALLECKELKLNISIDAYGPLNNYIRSGSEWDKIYNNLSFYNDLIYLRKDKETSIRIHTAISVYNVNLYQDLEKFTKTNFPRFSNTFQLVQFPVFLSIKNTPTDYKKEVVQFIENSAVIEYLNSSGENFFGHFVNFNKKLDALRNESIEQLNPLLTKFIEKYDNKSSFKESQKFLIEQFENIQN